MAGAPSQAVAIANHAEQCTNNDNTAAVRCCDDSGGGFSPDCQTLDYEGAAAHCASQGYRLCTKDGLDQTKTSGCGFDCVRAWTSSTPWSVLGKGSSVPLYTWGCGSNGVKGRPTPLSFCNGGTNWPLHYNKLDSIICEAVAHARFEIAKTVAHGGSTTETYDNCADTINCGATYSNMHNRCHHREFTQDPRIPLEYCKKSCALHGGTGNC